MAVNAYRDDGDDEFDDDDDDDNDEEEEEEWPSTRIKILMMIERDTLPDPRTQHDVHTREPQSIVWILESLCSVGSKAFQMERHYPTCE